MTSAVPHSMPKAAPAKPAQRRPRAQRTTFAIASPPRIPGYQASSTALTLSIHGMLTGPPVSSTTIVCGFAFTTA